jgi:hypothetical protein
MRKQINSDDLAALIVDALIDAKIVEKKDLASAIEIVAEEIQVRKAMGDY